MSTAPQPDPLPPTALLAQLEEILGSEGLRADPAGLERYGRDETEDLVFPPLAAALPKSAEEVSRLMRFASEHRIPVTPRGAGTGLSGGALPVTGGIALSVERLDRIRSIDSRNLIAEVESGVVTGEIKRRTEEIGLYYPPDPASRDTCMIGGNLAEDSAGPHSCKYGTTRAWVLGLEAVMPDGSVIRTGGRTRKDATGYNLTQLLIGSEGTLAVITAATLRLIARPAEALTLLIPFATLEAAAAAVEQIFHRGIDPAACELMDGAAIEAVGEVLPLPRSLEGQDAVLLIELDGNDPDELLARAGRLGELAEELEAGEPVVAQDAADQRRLWAIREEAGSAVKQRSIYKEADTVVPRSALADLVRAARKAAADHGLESACYGHAGDGNLHINLLRGELAGDQWEAQRDAAERQLFEAAVALGGRISGEHGIGWTQRQFLSLAVDPPTLALMRSIKQTFDPHGILNPEKIFPG